MRPDNNRYPVILITAVLAAAISGCGGGGSPKTDTRTGMPEEPTLTTAPVALSGVPDHGLMAMDAPIMIAAGYARTVGNVTFSCPAGGADCSVAVAAAADGMVAVTTTGGAATVGYSMAYIESRQVLTPSEVEEFVSDPRVSSALDIVAASDTLLVPAAHVRYSLSGPQQSIQVDERLEVASCESMRCVTTDGTEIDLSDITNADISLGSIESFDYPAGLVVTEANLESKQGLTTATLRAGANAADIVNLLAPGDEIDSLPSASVFGLWGQYGFAAMVIVDGAIAGTLDGSAYRGQISASLPFAIGEASHTNPAGIGGATWNGIAEAVSARTFERQQGTATVTIPDLSRPRVGVEIDVAGYQIGSPAWAAMPLVRGRYGAGRAGIDHLQGNFHGPIHSETYGVFDTGAYAGVFGATRTSNP